MRPNSPSRLLVLVFFGLVLAASLGMRTPWVAAARFDQTYPNFVEQNIRIRNQLRKRPQTLRRDQTLAAVESNLRWAARYRQTGVDPEFIEDLTYDPDAAGAIAAR